MAKSYAFASAAYLLRHLAIPEKIMLQVGNGIGA